MQNTQKTCKRDDTFYFEDGSCIIRVEDTLFNVSTIHYSPSTGSNDLLAAPIHSKQGFVEL